MIVKALKTKSLTLETYKDTLDGKEIEIRGAKDQLCEKYEEPVSTIYCEGACAHGHVRVNHSFSPHSL